MSNKTPLYRRAIQYARVDGFADDFRQPAQRETSNQDPPEMGGMEMG